MVKLIGFLMKISNETVQIELKNGSVVQGTVMGIDLSMNTHMKTVKMICKGSDPIRVDQMSIRGSHIRYYVLPDSINLDTILASLDSLKERPKKEPRFRSSGRGRGRGRSKK